MKITLMLVIFIICAISVLAQEVVVSNDFEKGTEKWESRGSVSISSSKDEALSGTKSLRVSGRREFWQGAQLNIIKLLSPGKTYKFTVSIKLAKNNNPDNVKMTIQRGSGNSESIFDNVAMVNANPDGWQTMSGTFKPSGSDGYILVYLEAEKPNTSFYVDDFKIEIAGDNIPTQSGVILQNDFEDMTSQNWTMRGDGVQMFSSNAFGSQNLKVAARTQNWHGLQLDVSPIFFKGRTYEISVQVRLVNGQPKDNLVVTMQQTPSKGEIQYLNIIPPTAITDAEWTTLTGKYTATTSNNNLILYIEAVGATTSFHIDNFSIKIP